MVVQLADIPYKNSGNAIAGISGVNSVSPDGSLIFNACHMAKGVIYSAGNIFAFVRKENFHDIDTEILL